MDHIRLEKLQDLGGKKNVLYIFRLFLQLFGLLHPLKVHLHKYISLTSSFHSWIFALFCLF